MNEFVPLLMAGLIVAALGGLAYLAYNEPAFFKWLFYPLLGLSLLLFLGVAVWNIATTNTMSALRPLIANGKIGEAYSISEALKVPSGAAMLCQFILIIYMALLGALSDHKLRKSESECPPLRKRKDG